MTLRWGSRQRLRGTRTISLQGNRTGQRRKSQDPQEEREAKTSTFLLAAISPKTNIMMDVQRQHDIQEIPAAIKISVVKNLFKAVEALADGSDELISELSMVMMRGIVATKPEAIGRMTNLWLEKQVAVGEFISLLREHM